MLLFVCTKTTPLVSLPLDSSLKEGALTGERSSPLWFRVGANRRNGTSASAVPYTPHA